MIDLNKMRRVLNLLSSFCANGMIVVTSKREIAIELTEQLNKEVHDWMVKKGFVFDNNMYIYRP